jgi:D-alanyl-D-alanine carboxypeptidase
LLFFLRSLIRVFALFPLVCVSVLVPGFGWAQNGKPIALTAEALLLLNDEGKVLLAKNAEAEHAPASLVKLMTLYLAYQDLEAGRTKLEAPVTISARAAQTPRYQMGLRAGEIVPLGLLLEGVAIASANDAATAVAEHLSGDEPSFVARMNMEAQRLGVVATRFANPHGLPDPGQWSTARDLATLMAKLLEDFPSVQTLLGRRHFVYRGKVYTRWIPLAPDSLGLQAVKTGFTNEAGYNLALAATRGGQRFLAILLGCESRRLSFLDAQKLLQYGVAQLGPGPRTDGAPVRGRRAPVRRSGS